MTVWLLTLTVEMSFLVGSVFMLFFDLPGSPIKIGQPRFLTITQFPRFHSIGNLQYESLRMMGESVSPIRVIDVDPAAIAHSEVLEKGRLSDEAKD